MTPYAIRCRRWPLLAGHLFMLGLLALMGPSCDKMPLTAPSNTTITLYAARLTVGLNGSVDITATVIESAGTPVQNGTVVTFTATLGSVEPLDARTGDGKVTVRFNAGSQSGTAEIRALSGGNAVKDALKISVGATAVSRVELLANPTALSASGGTSQLTAIVTDASGNRLGGVPVSFATDSGTLAPSSVTTDGVGEAHTILSTNAKAVVSASVAGGATGTVKSDNLTIAVRVGPTVSITVPGTSLVPGAAGVFSVTVTAGGSAVRTATINFGDGGSQAVSTSGTSSASHAYSRGGTFLVTATATDAAGESTTATASVNVQDVFVTITGLTVAPASPKTNEVADFSVAAASSSPTSAPIERYEWNFGDGATLTTSTSFTSHIYTKVIPSCTVSVRVVTTTGASATATKVIVVGGQDSGSVTISSFTVSPASPTSGLSADFTVAATASASAGTIASYEWDFGDGVNSTTSTAFTSHIYTIANPKRIVSVRVVTTTGASATATREIVVQ